MQWGLIILILFFKVGHCASEHTSFRVLVIHIDLDLLETSFILLNTVRIIKKTHSIVLTEKHEVRIAALHVDV